MKDGRPAEGPNKKPNAAEPSRIAWKSWRRCGRAGLPIRKGEAPVQARNRQRCLRSTMMQLPPGLRPPGLRPGVVVDNWR